MKSFPVTATSLIVIFLALGAIIAHRTDVAKKAYKKPFTAQQLSAHRITMYNKDLKKVGSCSATAIGPNALLTAEHCIVDEKEKAAYITVDLTTTHREILAGTLDGRDHAIILVGGPQFTHRAEIVQGDSAFPGEQVHMYGSGGGAYPPRELVGTEINCEDPSDQDAAVGITCFTMPVIGGDSGTAVYSKHGALVAVITYGIADDDADGAPTIRSVGFSLDFSTEQLRIATTFDASQL